MKQKRSLTVMSLLITFAWLVLSSTSILAATWYVAPASMGGNDNNTGISPSDPWEHISFAVDQAAAGDTIKVMDDNDEATDDYIENITIPNWRSNLILERYDDVDPNPQIKAEDPFNRVISVYGDSVTIRGFDIYGSTAVNDVGIYLHISAEYCIIEDNRCGYSDTRYNGDGIIVAEGSGHNIISGNIINYNWGEGILLEESSHSNTIADNEIHNNYGHGILIDHSDNNIISGNTFTYNRDYGIFPWISNNNTITGNICNYNKNGIHTQHVNNSTISGNECNHNTAPGIFIENFSNNNTVSNNICNSNGTSGIHVSTESNNNTVSGNTCNSNGTGISVYNQSTNNIISRNTCNSNDYGIYIHEYNSSNDNTIYFNNFSDNTSGNVYSNNSGNTWHSPTTIHYSYESMYKNYMGNYYSDYAGSDPDGDGIGNTPYDLPGLEPDDDYPLIQTLDQYLLQAWWLHSNSTMYGNNMTKPAGSVAKGSRGYNIWIANQTLQTDINFTGGSGQTWTGQIVFTSAPSNGHSFLLELGSWDGNNFTPGGPDATLNGDGSATIFTYETDNAPFTVNAGDYLALKLTNNSGSSYYVQTGGAWSYTSSPEGSDIFTVAVEEQSEGNIPVAFMFQQNYPNPFSGKTVAGYKLQVAAYVELTVFDINGKKVATLINQKQPPGEHEVEFNAAGLPAGIYYCRLTVGKYSQTKKMVLMR